MSQETLDRSLNLAQLALAFGRVERVTKHEDGIRPETDTDHTVMLGLIACDLCHLLGLPLDMGLVAQFSIVHDLVEARAGDTQTLTIDEAGRAEKKAREARAIEELRRDVGGWVFEMLERYERQEDPEARYVRVLDKVMPKLTHALNGCVSARKLTDMAGFVRAHEEQANKMMSEYPDVALQIHELLLSSMERAQEAFAADAVVETCPIDSKPCDCGFRRVAGGVDRQCPRLWKS